MSSEPVEIYLMKMRVETKMGFLISSKNVSTAKPVHSYMSSSVIEKVISYRIKITTLGNLVNRRIVF